MSLERPVYRVGREAGIAALGLRTGDRVLDVGCGTGLNLPLLRAAVGPSGAVVGLDASSAMLRQAHVRIRRHRWTNVTTVLGDAAETPPTIGEPFDALLFTYTLSVMDRWRQAWSRSLALVRPGGRIAVVDLGLPTGRWRLLAPLAWLACQAGGADPYRRPWQALTRTTADGSHEVFRAGHVHVAAGSSPCG
ncbi:class I SAM-dependent methyltransferase [Actinoplanes auranticolor]|uniref:class I SAM-dependent methyltransferase n=1 Tax=Actinoplanes auranticolor TaxID=47988 RepID=UPI001FE5F895|nr:methyltransferase domain-containing protein [Actinoplanes auranticolor]